MFVANFEFACKVTAFFWNMQELFTFFLLKNELYSGVYRMKWCYFWKNT